MTLYNLIALASGPRKPEQLRAVVTDPETGGPPSLEAVGHALKEMSRRGWVRVRECEGTVDVLDKKRRILVARDRTDAVVEADGSVSGGWEGWLVRCKEQGLLRLEDAIAGAE